MGALPKMEATTAANYVSATKYGSAPKNGSRGLRFMVALPYLDSWIQDIPDWLQEHFRVRYHCQTTYAHFFTAYVYPVKAIKIDKSRIFITVLRCCWMMLLRTCSQLTMILYQSWKIQAPLFHHMNAFCSLLKRMIQMKRFHIPLLLFYSHKPLSFGHWISRNNRFLFEAEKCMTQLKSYVLQPFSRPTPGNLF
jgi:hypothetical protein